MPTNTANYGWVKPDVDGSLNVWGGALNGDLDGIDSVVGGVSATLVTTNAQVSNLNTEVAALIAQGAGVQNVFQSVAAIHAATIPVATTQVSCLAYAVAGDLGGATMTFARVGSQPAFPGYVQSADGAWWQLTNKVVSPEMFGAFADLVHDDYPAISAMLAYVNNLNQEYPFEGTGKTGFIRCEFPNNNYISSQTITLGSVSAPSGWGTSLKGNNNGQPGSPQWTNITFPANTTGFLVLETSHTGVTIDGFSIVGTIGDGTGTAHGIMIQGACAIKNCQIRSFTFDGIHMDTHPSFLADRTFIENIDISGIGRHGIFLSGPDSNICTVMNVSVRSVGGSAVWNEAFFFSTFINIQATGTGYKTYQQRAGISGAVCKGSDGNYYGVVPNQETAASTTDPTTNTLHTIWAKFPSTWNPGPTSLVIPTWTTGLTWQSAPAFFDSALSTLIMPYVEAPFSPPAIWSGQIIGAVPYYGQTNYQNDPTTSISNAGTHQGYITQRGWSVEDEQGFQVSIGTEKALLNYSAPGQGGFVWVVGPNNDPQMGNGTGSGSGIAFGMTIVGTATTFGRASPVPWAAYFPQGISLQDGPNGGQLITQSISPPSGQAWGETCLCTNPRGNFSPTGWSAYYDNNTGFPEWAPISIAAPQNHGKNVVSTAPTSNNLSLTAANIFNGVIGTTLALTATLAAAATATLPLVTDLVTAINGNYSNMIWPGKTMELVVCNGSSAAFNWTMTTNTGWSLVGTQSVVQNTWRKFILSFATLTTATLTATGETGPYVP